MEVPKLRKLIMEQHKSDNVELLSKCHCETPGFCPIFFRRMGTYPPDWEWCQNAPVEDKKVFYDTLAKAPKTDNHRLLEFFKELDNQNIEKKFYLLYYLTMSDKYHLCEKAQESQKQKNKTITEYIDNQSRSRNLLDDLQILCLGHSNKQFDSIHNRSYLKKINLNDIDAGKYSDNKWAESRAFISEKELFAPSAKFVGFTTASWNLKYEAYSRIDELHNWETCHILLNSKPEDKIVLCADMFCPCIWFEKQENVSSVFFGENYKLVGDIFYDMFGFSVKQHMKVPFSNQMILHRENYEIYKEYLLYNQIFEKVTDFIDTVKKYMNKNEEVKYSFNRLNAYVLEMISTFWFSGQNFIYLPNAERKIDWYSSNNVYSRIAKW